MSCIVTTLLCLVSKCQCELALYLPLSRLHPTGMLYKQEVCLPWATSLIVFFALSPPQATSHTTDTLKCCQALDWFNLK